MLKGKESGLVLVMCTTLYSLPSLFSFSYLLLLNYSDCIVAKDLQDEED